MGEDLPRARGRQQVEVEGEQAPAGRTPRAAVGCVAAAYGRWRDGRATSSAHASDGPGVPAGEQRGQVVVGRRGAAPWRPRRRRRPARAPGRRTSGAATSRKMPIGTCAMLGSSRRDSANAVDGSSACASWRDDAGRVGLGLGGDHREPPASARTTTCVGRRPRTGSPSVRWTSRACGLVAVLEHVERAVVEDRAVLVDLDQRRAAVLRGRPQHLGEVLAVGVHGARDERRLGAEGQRHRVERVCPPSPPASTW